MREAAEQARLGHTSDDGRLSVNWGGFAQVRLSHDGEAKNHASLPRTRLYSFGYLLGPEARYRIMIGTAGNDPGVRVFDAFAEWSPSEAVRVRAGYFKIPALREWMESARLLGSVERSSATVAVLPGRGTGMMLSGDLSKYTSYAIGAFDGPPEFQELGPTSALRTVWNLSGKPIEGEIDFDDSTPRLAIGTSMLGRQRDDSAQPYTHEVLYAGDVAARARGFDVAAEGFVRRRFGGSQVQSDIGGFVRFDQYVPAIRSSFGGRVSGVDMMSETRGREVELDVELGWYPFGHQLKWVGDAGIRASRSGTVPTVRLQMQAAF